jgi:hypothetical protein
MTDDKKFKDMHAYKVIENAKSQIMSILKGSGMIDLDDITDEHLNKAVSFMYSIETRLLTDDVDDDVKLDRLRTLAINLFMAIQTGTEIIEED